MIMNFECRPWALLAVATVLACAAPERVERADGESGDAGDEEPVEVDLDEDEVIAQGIDFENHLEQLSD